MKTQDWKPSWDPISGTASGPSDATAGRNWSKLEVFRAEADSDLNMAVSVEYVIDIPVGGFTSVTLMPYFFGRDCEWHPEAQRQNEKDYLLHLFKFFFFKHFCISQTRKLRFREVSDITQPGSSKIKIQTPSLSSLHYISGVELGAAQPLWVDKKPGFCDGRGVKVTAHGHSYIQAKTGQCICEGKVGKL